MDPFVDLTPITTSDNIIPKINNLIKVNFIPLMNKILNFFPEYKKFCEAFHPVQLAWINEIKQLNPFFLAKKGT